jgi:membrane protein DedA with SNARE-associated domain
LFLLMQGLYDRFGIPIVLIAAISEATVGVGVVFPGQVLMFLAGAYTRNDPGSLGLVFLAAFVGTIIGDTFSYTAGRWGGHAVEGTRFGPTLRLGRALMMGRTRWMIPFYHLHSVTRAVGPFGAGAIRMPLRVWMPLDFLGAAISNAIWVGAGALFGAAMLEPDGTLKQHPALRIGLYLLAVGWFVAMQSIAQRRLRDLRGEESSEDASPEAATGADQAELGPDADNETDRAPALRS